MRNGGPDSPEVAPELLEQFDSQFNRIVVQYFLDHSTDVATLDDVGHFVCDHDGTTTDEASVFVRLHHWTLPRLAERGIIDYDVDAETIHYQGDLGSDA